MSKTLKLSRKIKGSPEEVYRAFTNPFTIELWSDEPATMEEKEETEFSILGGNITGRNISFIPNKQITQEWYFGEEEPSIVTITIDPQGKNSNVFVEQTNIPDEAYDNILEGWKESYLGAIRDFFEA